jgi:hypothetical protein
VLVLVKSGGEDENAPRLLRSALVG